MSDEGEKRFTYLTAESANRRFTVKEDALVYTDPLGNETTLPSGNVVQPGEHYNIKYWQNLGEDSTGWDASNFHLESVIKHDQKDKAPLWRYVFRSEDTDESITLFTEDGEKFGLRRPYDYEQTTFVRRETPSSSTLTGDLTARVLK